MEAILEYEAVMNLLLSGKIVEILKRPFYKAFTRESVTVSSEQYAILSCLVKQNRVTQQTLCQMTKKDKPNVTRLIDRLESKGLVQRIADAEDKRKKRIHITEQGVSVYEKMNHIVNEMFTRALGDIDTNQFAVFQNVLRRMTTNLSRIV